MNNKPKKLINIYVLFLFDGCCLQLGDDGFKGGRGGLEGDRRGVASGTEDNQRRAVVETTVVGDVELVGIVVSTADGYYTGIALDSEMELVLRHRYTTPFAVDSFDAEMHKVSTVGYPCGVLWGYPQSHGLACGLDPMASHWFPVGIGHSLKIAVSIRNVVPTDQVALLGVVFGVGLATQTLAVKNEFRLIGIGVGDK